MECIRQLTADLAHQEMPAADILKELKGLNISRSTIYRYVRRYKETGRIERRKNPGSPRTVRTKRLVKSIASKIRRNPERSMQNMAREAGVSATTMRRLVHQDLGHYPYRTQTTPLLSEEMKRKRRKRYAALRQWLQGGTNSKILFSDEKLFTVEQSRNRQNTRILSPKGSPTQKLIPRAKKPQGVMVWAGVTADGRTPLVFFPPGVTVTQESYERLVLQGTLLPYTQHHFGHRPWTFQQDSAPAHTARNTQRWLRGHTIRFITPEQWPPSSPDLNPMDYVWPELQLRACTRRHPNVAQLKASLARQWRKIPQDQIRAACEGFEGRLYYCEKKKGALYGTA